VQIAEPEHWEAAVLVSVTLTPFLAMLTVCPPKVVDPEADVAEPRFMLNEVVVAPPHTPETGTEVADTVVPVWDTEKEPERQQHEAWLQPASMRYVPLQIVEPWASASPTRWKRKSAAKSIF
jgi:hypothetical protein